MHVHLPKALHDWRELAREVAIIVIGVLIALTAEQLVDSWHWRHKVAAATDAMRHELLWDDGPQIYQRAAMYPCIAKQLDAIRAAVEAGEGRPEVSDLIRGYWVQSLSYDNVAHEAADTSDITSHIPTAQLEPFTLAYAIMPFLDRTAATEAVDSARLRAFQRTGGALSEAERMQVLNAVEQLRNDNDVMENGARWTLPQLKKIGRLDPRRTRAFMTHAAENYGTCLKAVPDVLPNALTH
jgi:hypothetical protein